MIPDVHTSQAELADRLRRRLAEPLPAERAQRRFSPSLAYGRHHGPPFPGARDAAVMALLYPSDGLWRIPLILRPFNMRDHAGQISLPGGAVDPGETTREAALRELREELGVDPRTIDLLGELSPVYVFVTRYRVTPLLAIAGERPPFEPSPREVAELIEAPLCELANQANHRRRIIARRALRFSAPEIAIHGHSIWGATSIILGELLELFRELSP